MAGVNKVILIGNLGAKPEVRHLESGSVVANFNIATTEKYKNKAGQLIEQTEWHRLELWDNLAKIAEQYLDKGSQVYVEGKLRTEEWTDKDGVSRRTTKIRVNNMTLLGSRGGSDTGNKTAATTSNANQTANSETASFEPIGENPDDDLPF
ncbi:MAG: single-stranded DNA-binding protein [Thermonemataceae bacterium]